VVWTAGMSVRVPKVRAFQRLLQSSSASLFTTGAFGFLTFTQCGERPERYGESIRFETMSRP
jgi:hypothetical protein